MSLWCLSRDGEGRCAHDGDKAVGHAACAPRYVRANNRLPENLSDHDSRDGAFRVSRRRRSPPGLSRGPWRQSMFEVLGNDARKRGSRTPAKGSQPVYSASRALILASIRGVDFPISCWIQAPNSCARMGAVSMALRPVWDSRNADNSANSSSVKYS